MTGTRELQQRHIQSWRACSLFAIAVQNYSPLSFGILQQPTQGTPKSYAVIVIDMTAIDMSLIYNYFEVSEV